VIGQAFVIADGFGLLDALLLTSPHCKYSPK